MDEEETLRKLAEDHERKRVEEIAKEDLFRYYKFMEEDHLVVEGFPAKHVANRLTDRDVDSIEFAVWWKPMTVVVRKQIEKKRTSTTQGLKTKVISKCSGD